MPKYRIPYSGHIYPDTGGGTMSACEIRSAFNPGAMPPPASNAGMSAFQEEQFIPQRGGLFGIGTAHGASQRNALLVWPLQRLGRAASIRHAEPQQQCRSGTG